MVNELYCDKVNYLDEFLRHFEDGVRVIVDGGTVWYLSQKDYDHWRHSMEAEGYTFADEVDQ